MIHFEIMRKSILTFILLMLFSELHSDEWIQFRGTNGQGLSKDSQLPIKWSRTEGIAWKTNLDGVAWSSPICVDKQVFLTNALLKGEELKLEVLAINFETGAINWRIPLFQYSSQPRIHRKNSYASPTPFYENGRIFVHFGNLGTACITLRGEIIWKTKLEYSPVHGSGASPVIYNNLLLLSADGANNPKLYALNKNDGTVRWEVNRDSNAKKSFSFCTPTVIQWQGKPLIVSPASDYVFAYDLEGKQVWKFNYPNGYSVVPRPVYNKGIVYVSSGYDSPVLYAIKLGGMGDITDSHLAWKTRKGVPRNSSFLVVDDLLFMAADNGVVSCLDSTNGEVKWVKRVAGSCSSSLLYASGKIYLTDESGITYIFLSKNEFKLIETNELNERTLASPVPHKGFLLIRTELGLWKIAS